MLKYWIKVISGPRDRLRYIMYTFLKEMMMANQRVIGCKNWASEILNILTEVGQVGVWYSEDIGMDARDFISMSKSTMIDLYIQDWWRELQTKEKMVNYVLFKTNFGHELYLSHVASVKCRMALTRLRLSSHKLNIELGRYHPRVPRHRRYCTQCNGARLDIEDEYHFVLICEKYRQLRVSLIPAYYRINPSMAKFVQLMADVQDDHVTARDISNYIVKALVLREV